MAKSKKVNKWKAAPESIRKLKDTIGFLFDRLEVQTYAIDDPEYKELVDEIYKGLGEALDDYNELEAKHNADCGLISKLEEENKYCKQDIEDLESKLDSLNKVITRKNAEMCNLKWERDETEKKIKILTEDLIRRYNINVTFYQRPGIDMHGLKNFGVHIDCEENRKAFNELKEELNKYKAKNEKLEEKHAKATRFISRLTEALNEAGVEFHYVKFNGDGEEIFYIDSVVDRMAKKHYEEQSFRLRNTVRNYRERMRCFENDISELKAEIYKLEEDRKEIEHRNLLLLKALDRVGIRPTFDIRADKWLIQYTDKAENAFLAADQIKRDAEKKIGKLVSALDKCRLDAKWDHENDKWCIYVRPSDTELTSVSFDLCEVVEGYEKLKNENKALILEKGDLKSKNHSWQTKCNNLQRMLDFKLHEGTPCGITNCPKVVELTAVINGLNDYTKALKGRIQELEDRSKDIYNLATIGWINDSMYGYEEIRKMLSFDPKE